MRGGYQRYGLDYHPLDVVGWDGYVYPYTFNIDDFEPIAGRVHMPPPVHQTFQGPNFVICSFCPRMLDWDADAIPIPYNHSNLQSEEMIYYVSGDFGSRRGIDVGLDHAASIRPAPRPAAGPGREVDRQRFTDELAVMCDTFRPLRLTPLCQELDDGRYAPSWATQTTTASPQEVPSRCLRKASSTRRSPPPPTARSPSTSTRTTPASATPTTAPAATTSPPGRCGWDARRPSRSRTSTTPRRKQEVWRTVCRELAAKHERLACAEYREAMAALALPGGPHPPARRGRQTGCAR